MKAFKANIYVLMLPLFMVALLLAVAAAPSLATSPKNPACATPPIYNESYNGKTVTLANGSVFYVKLSANPTTGYAWSSWVSPGMTVLEKKYVPSAAPSGIVGAGGYYQWKIKVVKPPVTNYFRASYARPFGPQKPIKTYVLRVNVI